MNLNWFLYERIIEIVWESYMSTFMYLWKGKFEFKSRLYGWFVDSCSVMKLYGWMWMWNCETDLGKKVRNVVWAIWYLENLLNELD